MGSYRCAALLALYTLASITAVTVRVFFWGDTLAAGSCSKIAGNLCCTSARVTASLAVFTAGERGLGAGATAPVFGVKCTKRGAGECLPEKAAMTKSSSPALGFCRPAASGEVC